MEQKTWHDVGSLWRNNYVILGYRIYHWRFCLVPASIMQRGGTSCLFDDMVPSFPDPEISSGRCITSPQWAVRYDHLASQLFHAGILQIILQYGFGLGGLRTNHDLMDGIFQTARRIFTHFPEIQWIIFFYPLGGDMVTWFHIKILF